MRVRPGRGSGLRVWGLGLGALGLRVWGLGLRVWGLGLGGGLEASGCRSDLWGFLVGISVFARALWGVCDSSTCLGFTELPEVRTLFCTDFTT